MMETWFLALTVFFPRIGLLAAYLTGTYPPNNVPNMIDVILWVILPRLLMLIYIYDNMGTTFWFWIHLVAAIIVWFGGSRYAKRRWWTD
jgi:hypothetical protein